MPAGYASTPLARELGLAPGPPVAFVHASGLGAGLVDAKVCVVDDVGSGPNFVRWLRDRVQDRTSALAGTAPTAR